LTTLPLFTLWQCRWQSVPSLDEGGGLR